MCISCLSVPLKTIIHLFLASQKVSNISLIINKLSIKLYLFDEMSKGYEWIVCKKCHLSCNDVFHVNFAYLGSFLLLMI